MNVPVKPRPRRKSNAADGSRVSSYFATVEYHLRTNKAVRCYKRNGVQYVAYASACIPSTSASILRVI